MRNLRHILACAVVALGMFGAASLGSLAPASAQTVVVPTVPVCGYWNASGNWVDNGTCSHNPYCGSMVSGTWVPNGACPDTRGYIPQRAYVSGTITKVSGHLVTVQQSQGEVVINDQPALNRQSSGRVAVGRQITAYGFWRGGTFYATAIE
jgi:hypothetical protein